MATLKEKSQAILNEKKAKIFETVEIMNQDENATLDDMAIVYSENLVNSTNTTHTTKIYFPETVVITPLALPLFGIVPVILLPRA